MTALGAWVGRVVGLCQARRRAIFVVYALLTATATHWPKLELPLPSLRPDIIIHMGVFGLWTLICVNAGFFGPPLSRRNILLGGLVSLVYSVVDELTQGIPGINRVVGLDDALANAAGVVAAVIACLVLARWQAASAEQAAKPMTRQ